MKTWRAEIFSDAVFAIAITLLVLDLEVPSPEGGPLAEQLREQWPGYVAYALSFGTVGIIWLNHHLQFERLERTDHWVLVLNLVLLFAVAAVPFPTAIVSEYLQADDGTSLAVALYAATVLAMGLAYFTIWEYAARKELVGERLDRTARRRLMRRNLVGPAGYGLAVPLAFVSPYASLGLCAVAGLYYVVPGRWEV